jgi:hypothetical protein
VAQTRRSKISKVLREYGKGELHSGSKSGPKVTSRKQAVAIALNSARKEGEDVPPPRRVSRGHYGKRGGRKAA